MNISFLILVKLVFKFFFDSSKYLLELSPLFLQTIFSIFINFLSLLENFKIEF